MKKKNSHCIVTPDFIGPIKNGGIGTACYELACFLTKKCDAEVTVVFTSTVAVDSSKKWASHYQDNYGWRFISVDDLPCLPDIPHHTSPWFQTRSLQIHQWLKEQDFTHIHFQDWHANGFVPVQAKRSGVAYIETLLSCTIHSPQEWSEEGNLLFAGNGLESMLQRHCEKYAASHADVSIFPSRHMLEYVQGKSWVIDHAVVVPYLFRQGRATGDQGACKVTELCFFGRLETRKGLEAFTGALERVISHRGVSSLPKITFIGKPGLVGGRDALEFLKAFRERCSIEIEILSDLDAAQAQGYLKAAPGRLAVVPSLLDNLPYVIIECLQNSIPVIASKVGGIPELIGSAEHLFEPNGKALSECLERMLDDGCPRVETYYNLSKAEMWWESLAASEPSAKAQRAPVNPACITVCIAYYNYGAYLPQLLESLEKQTVAGFGVVVINDGSTDEHSNEVFAEMRGKYEDRLNWKFVTQSNSGIGVARNRAVASADTEYITFMDADNLAKPEMIERMAMAIGTSKADCLTCYMEGFVDGESGAQEVIYRYTPTGNCPEAGCFENVFGDANCIVRRDAFEEIGKFSHDRDSSFEDWEFLAKMSLNGKRLDVIPEFLHLYRHTDQGFSRNTSAFKNRQRILNVYRAHLPEWAGRLLECSYASIVDVRDIASTRAGNSSRWLKWIEIYRPLPRIHELAGRTSRVVFMPFKTTKYLSRYRHVMRQKGSAIDWCKWPRIHYILFGDKFPI